MTNSEKIQELSEIWGRCCTGHHKDRDIRHCITQEYYFGNLKYRVEHFAYIGTNINGSFNTLVAAQNYLIKELHNQIKEQIDWNIESFKNPGEYDTEQTLEYWGKMMVRFIQIRNQIIDNIPGQINFEEEYWKLKKQNELLNYSNKRIEEILDDFKIKKYDEGDMEMEYSLDYRIRLLINKLKGYK